MRKSGGAHNNNYKHGKSNTSIYVVWDGMKRRCFDPKCEMYRYYGGRGIKVCDKWLKFSGFYEDMGDRPEGMEIDRIDSNGNYELNNCRWVSHKENSRNRRNNKLNHTKVSIIKGLLKSGNYTHKYIASIFGVNRSMISYIRAGKNWKGVE